MSAVRELLYTLYNEITNSDWTFGGQPMAEVNINEERMELQIILPKGKMLRVKVREALVSDKRVCPVCKNSKEGWPDKWSNIAAGKGLLYACESCSDAQARLQSIRTMEVKDG